MTHASLAANLLRSEARALRHRVDDLRPYSLLMPMVPAAGPHANAMRSVERFMDRGRSVLRARIDDFLAWIERGPGRGADPALMQRRFTFLKLRFLALTSQFDIYADALNQRAEHETGTWLAGLDELARDALRIPGFLEAPPLLCYLDRGHGAAIRRARTRLPGGGLSPAAIIRVPRERMIGHGIGGSLVHEVGHQAAAMLGLVESLRPVLRSLRTGSDRTVLSWTLWDRWISEIVADFWAVARLGVGATIGHFGLVSLPRPFVFRLSVDDPHPIGWIRVLLSCEMGRSLDPHPQWTALAELWRSLYPPEGLTPLQRNVLSGLEETMPSLATLIADHRPRALRGHSLAEALGTRSRSAERLLATFEAWKREPRLAHAARPTFAFAVLGQAQAAGRTTPERERATMSRLLVSWALRGASNGAVSVPMLSPWRDAGAHAPLRRATAVTAA